MRTLSLLYHVLRPTRTPYTYALDVESFTQQLALFQTIRQTPNPPITPEITFDDGHLSNHDHALPLLERHGLHAHFFITVGWTGQKSEYMSWDQIRALHQAGQHIGAHGWTHTLLTHCSPKDLHHELHDARHELEDHLGAPIATLSLPGGRSNRRVLEACHAAGYTRVFTSVPRPEPIPPGPTTGRLNIRGDMTLPWIATLFDPQSPTLQHLERRHRLKETAKSLLGDRLYATLWSLWNRPEPPTP